MLPSGYNPGIELHHPPPPVAFSLGGDEEGASSPLPNSCCLQGINQGLNPC